VLSHARCMALVGYGSYDTESYKPRGAVIFEEYFETLHPEGAVEYEESEVHDGEHSAYEKYDELATRVRD
jgi:hypothetical protein